MKDKIFWLEDDIMTNVYHIDALKKRYEVIVEAAQSYIDQLRAPAESFDVLIIDLMIHPYGRTEAKNGSAKNVHYAAIAWRYTGIEFLRRVRAGEYAHNGFPSDIPIVVITGIGDDKAEAEARKLADGPLLTKPCAIDALLEAVASALESREQHHA